MGTPVKRLASISSRLSPRNFGKSPTLFQNNSPSPRKTPRFLSPAPIQNFPGKSPKFPGTSRKIPLLIDTPGKVKISQNGLEHVRNFHVLGSGSFGKVVKATWKGEPCAAKIQKTTHHRPIQEKNALNLSHGNIVRILEILQDPLAPYVTILMEYHPGSRNLQESLPIAPELIQEYSLGISRGVEYCHSRKILHLDLKPGNVLVCDGICKLVDFGNSLDLNLDNPIFQNHGTVKYSSPELLCGNYPDFKCDVYSLGIIFWQMETGSDPYPEIWNQDEIMYRVVKFDLRPTGGANTGLYADLYKRCWDKEPDIRPTAQEITEQLINYRK